MFIRRVIKFRLSLVRLEAATQFLNLEDYQESSSPFAKRKIAVGSVRINEMSFISTCFFFSRETYIPNGSARFWIGSITLCH